MTGPLPRWLLSDTATIGEGGRLRIGGCDLLDLTEEFGTPLFVYDEAHLRARCREAVAAFGEDDVGELYVVRYGSGSGAVYKVVTTATNRPPVLAAARLCTMSADCRNLNFLKLLHELN